MYVALVRKKFGKKLNYPFLASLANRIIFAKGTYQKCIFLFLTEKQTSFLYMLNVGIYAAI